MREHFAYDFSRVRVYTDDRAAASAASLHAQAYAFGEHIVFARGKYAPGTGTGDRLIAHELVHVMQQSGLTGVRPSASRGSDPAEAEAARMASAPAPRAGGAPGVASAASQSPVVQCAPAAKPALDLLSRSDVLAAVDEAWLQSFGHPPFHAATLVDDMGMPTNPNYQGNRYEGVDFRETYFYTDADGKPSPIQVSPLPLDIVGTTTPEGTTAAFHTHPDQKRANPSETGSASIDAVLTVDEQAARQQKMPVYIIGQKTIREIYFDGKEIKTQSFLRRALRRQSGRGQ